MEFTDTTDLATLAAAIRPGQTRLLWVETPANPTWEITDLAAACELAHAAGVRVAADTVATPVHARPFELGAGLVVRSASKYLNAHMALPPTPGRAASRTAPPGTPLSISYSATSRRGPPRPTRSRDRPFLGRVPTDAECATEPHRRDYLPGKVARRGHGCQKGGGNRGWLLHCHKFGHTNVRLAGEKIGRDLA